MGDLGLIQGNDHDENADTETCDRPAAVKIPKVLRGCLQGAAQAEDQRAQDDGPATTEAIGSEACNSSAEKGTSRKDGNDGTAKGEGW
jgi:hypothetical protein